MTSEKPKVVLIQNVISPYRIPLFTKLDNCSEIEFNVLLTTEYCKHRPDWNRDLAELPFRCEALKGLSWSKNHASTYFFSPGLLWWLAKKKPQVVVGNGFSFATLLATIYCALSNGRLIVWTESTSLTESNVSSSKKSLRRNMARFADRFITAGELSKQYVQSLSGSSDQIPVNVCYNSVDVNAFCFGSESSKSIANRRKRVLFVGRLDENKNVKTLVEAFLSLPDSNSAVGPQLALCGDGPLYDWAEKKSESLSTDSILVFGQVDYQRVPEHYQNADVFVLISLSDCNPLVILEAMSSGLPIVCTRNAGNASDFIKDGVNGYIVDPTNVGEISLRIGEILEWSEERLADARVYSKGVLEKTSYNVVSANFVKAILDTLE